MIVAVKSCEAHWGRCSAIRETWGQSPMVQFFTGNFLDVPDSYEALPYKTQAICKWIVNKGHDWAFLCDTDTYVSMERLIKVSHKHYRGYRLEGKHYASGGAGYLLSGKAMKVIAEGDPAGFKNEDEMVGTLLEAAKIRVFHDPRFSLYEDVLPGNEIISRHLSSRKAFSIEMMYEAHKRATSDRRS